MQIDGRPVKANGSLVIGAGESATLDLSFGTFALVFNQAQTPNIQITVNPNQVLFHVPDNPLGMAATFNNIPTTSGPAHMSFVVYTIGDGAGATRLVHYTVS
jgi:hypothetical protein